MRRSIAAVPALLIAASCLAAPGPDLSPQDFADAVPITTPASAAAYRVAIPLEVYRKVVHDDLRDLRVFNARGEVVPYELQAPQPTPPTRPEGTVLPLFPLRGNARVTLDGLRISVQSNAAAVSVQAHPEPAQPAAITGYVIDARGVDLPLSVLQLHWPDGAPDFSASLRVESSDDLATWRIVTNDVPILNLSASGTQLVQSRVELPSAKAKFWRLTWVGHAPPLEMSSVTAETTPDRAETARASLIVPGTDTGDKRQEFAFDLATRLPVTELNIELPEPNSVAGVQILSRARSADPWRQITHGEFYRIGKAGSERRNPPIVIARNPDRFWLARLDQPFGTVSGSAPKLEVSWNAQDVVFLAHGSGPFMLAYGSGAAEDASTALASLLNGVTVLRAESGAPQPLGGSARRQPAPRQFPWKVTVLWTVLGLGVVLLGYMAYRLSRELGSSRAEASRSAKNS